MLNSQLELLNKNKILLADEAKQNEALYLLQYLGSVPLPIWSADTEARIVHWAGAAEKPINIERSAPSAGTLSTSLLATRKKQAYADLRHIISGYEGLEHFNLCKDRDKDGRQVYLVTCCFPVFDPRRREIVQAELSFDLSQLEALEEELEEMHARHSAEKDEERNKRIARERSLVDELRQAYNFLWLPKRDVHVCCDNSTIDFCTRRRATEQRRQFGCECSLSVRCFCLLVCPQ